MIEDKFVYSHHAKDPAYLKLCNAFDIVRIHKFSDMDDAESYKAMRDFASGLEEVKLLAAILPMQMMGTGWPDLNMRRER